MWLAACTRKPAEAPKRHTRREAGPQNPGSPPRDRLVSEEPGKSHGCARSGVSNILRWFFTEAACKSFSVRSPPSARSDQLTKEVHHESRISGEVGRAIRAADAGRGGGGSDDAAGRPRPAGAGAVGGGRRGRAADDRLGLGDRDGQ